MFRRSYLLLFTLAALIILAPLLHSHPLSGGDAAGLSNPSVCAICAVAAQQITVVRTVVHAPTIVVDRIVAIKPQLRSVDVSLSLASRAPPRA